LRVAWRIKSVRPPPAGNIKEWCSVALCDYNPEGVPIVPAGGQQVSTAPPRRTTSSTAQRGRAQAFEDSPIDDALSPLAKELGVSVQMLYIAAIILILVLMILAYTCLCGKKRPEYDSDSEEYKEARRKHRHHHHHSSDSDEEGGGGGESI
jgi:hypothetical protein